MGAVDLVKGVKVVGVIPARIGSTRLPGKPLADICGMPMIAHVLMRAKMADVLDKVIVATDDLRVVEVVEKFGGYAVLTSASHTTGIERAEEALRGESYDVAVIINGDEAVLNPDHIKVSVQTLLSSSAPTALLASPYERQSSFSDFKVVVNLKGEAMYFSREDIPSPSRSGVVRFLKAYHIISFRSDFLRKYVELPRTPMEIIEGHDHLRVLEHGYSVKIGIVDHQSVSVDTQEDLDFVRMQMSNDPIYSKYKAAAF